MPQRHAFLSLFVYRSQRFHRFVAFLGFLYCVWFTVGLVVTSARERFPVGPWADLTFLILGAAFLFFHSLTTRPTGVCILLFLWIALFSGIVETIGTLTGIPFGHYTYTDYFGFRLLGILPLAIPLAWYIVIWPLHLLVRSSLAGRSSVWLVPLGVALLATWTDVVIEPVAVHREYWVWEGGGVYHGVPWLNFFGWFITAFIISFICQILIPHAPPKRHELTVPLFVFLSTVFTFVLTNFLQGYWIGFGSGVALILVVLWARRRGRTEGLGASSTFV